MKNGNVFGSDSKTYNAYRQPLWLEVKERKLGGGTISLANVAKGTLIPAAVPVYLAKMGGTAVIVDAYTVGAAVSASSTSVKLTSLYGTKLTEGTIVGKADANGSIATAGALGATSDGETFAITAGALGTLAKGDIVYVASAAGSNVAAVKPNGLSWREIYVDTDNATVATVAVVTKGQILGDRCPDMADWVKAAVDGITFEYEL